MFLLAVQNLQHKRKHLSGNSQNARACACEYFVYLYIEISILKIHEVYTNARSVWKFSPCDYLYVLDQFQSRTLKNEKFTPAMK